MTPERTLRMKPQNLITIDSIAFFDTLRGT
jgi:hypothetical protein